MSERKITIQIGGEQREVYAGNAALRRFRRAGGKMADLSEFDSEDRTTDDTLDMLDAMLLLIHSNLVERREGETVDAIADAFPTMEGVVKAAGELFDGVDWLKNAKAPESGAS